MVPLALISGFRGPALWILDGIENECLPEVALPLDVHLPMFWDLFSSSFVLLPEAFSLCIFLRRLLGLVVVPSTSSKWLDACLSL